MKYRNNEGGSFFFFFSPYSLLDLLILLSYLKFHTSAFPHLVENYYVNKQYSFQEKRRYIVLTCPDHNKGGKKKKKKKVVG